MPEVGDWAERKYQLLWSYADLFATSMKRKWDERVFIDLFAGAGYARIRGTSRIVQSSSLLALQVTDPFDRYVFCDSQLDCIHALQQRVDRLGMAGRCQFEHCNVNSSCSEVLSALPAYGPHHRVLSFCFADPFKLSDFKFETIRSLSSRYMDFLLLIPAMDPIRNEVIYYQGDSTIVSDYLDKSDWRTLRTVGDRSVPFDLFIARCLDKQMRAIGYAYGGLSETVMVRSTEKNLPLYRLGFYSRNQLAERFWKDAKKYSDPQGALF